MQASSATVASRQQSSECNQRNNHNSLPLHDLQRMEDHTYVGHGPKGLYVDRAAAMAHSNPVEGGVKPGPFDSKADSRCTSHVVVWHTFIYIYMYVYIDTCMH